MNFKKDKIEKDSSFLLLFEGLFNENLLQTIFVFDSLLFPEELLILRHLNSKIRNIFNLKGEKLIYYHKTWLNYLIKPQYLSYLRKKSDSNSYQERKQIDHENRKFKLLFPSSIYISDESALFSPKEVNLFLFFSSFTENIALFEWLMRKGYFRPNERNVKDIPLLAVTSLKKINQKEDDNNGNNNNNNKNNNEEPINEEEENTKITRNTIMDFFNDLILIYNSKNNENFDDDEKEEDEEKEKEKQKKQGKEENQRREKNQNNKKSTKQMKNNKKKQQQQLSILKPNKKTKRFFLQVSPFFKFIPSEQLYFPLSPFYSQILLKGQIKIFGELLKDFKTYDEKENFFTYFWENCQDEIFKKSSLFCIKKFLQLIDSTYDLESNISKALNYNRIGEIPVSKISKYQMNLNIEKNPKIKLSTLRWFFEIKFGLKSDIKEYKKENNKEDLIWILENSKIPVVMRSRILWKILKKEKIELVEIFLSKYQYEVEEVFEEFIQFRSLDLVQNYYKQNETELSYFFLKKDSWEKLFCLAASTGNISVLKWILFENPSFQNEFVPWTTINFKYMNLENLKILISEFKVNFFIPSQFQNFYFCPKIFYWLLNQKLFYLDPKEKEEKKLNHIKDMRLVVENQIYCYRKPLLNDFHYDFKHLKEKSSKMVLFQEKAKKFLDYLFGMKFLKALKIWKEIEENYPILPCLKIPGPEFSFFTRNIGQILQLFINTKFFESKYYKIEIQENEKKNEKFELKNENEKKEEKFEWTEEEKYKWRETVFGDENKYKIFLENGVFWSIVLIIFDLHCSIKQIHPRYFWKGGVLADFANVLIYERKQEYEKTFDLITKIKAKTKDKFVLDQYILPFQEKLKTKMSIL